MSPVLYIHGFASCGVGQKSSALRTYFGEEAVDAPDLPYAPDDAIAFLEGMLTRRRYRILVGSSLGGFYATYLAEKFGMDAVLINPSVAPYETLMPYVGWQERFCDREVFEFKSIYIEQMKHYRSSPCKGRYLVLLQSGDEVLDYRKAQLLYQGQRVIVEEGGNHRFENLEDYLCMIERFCNANQKS